jgi:hypothetical protein
VENIAEVDFQLIGKCFDPNELSEYIGIDFTESEVAESGTVFWVISLKESMPMVDVLFMCHKIVDMIEPKKCKLIDAIRKYGLEPMLLVRINRNPDCFFNYEPRSSVIQNCFIDKKVMLFLCSIDANYYQEEYDI